MTVIIAPDPVLRFVDGNGNALSGGKLFTYAAGTTTKQNTFTDQTGATPNTNPVILNSRGEANVWLTPTLAYKFVLSPSTDTDPPTNPIYTVDQISAGLQGTVNGTLSFTGAANNETSATLASAATVNIGAAAANYIFITGTTTITAFDTVQSGVERTLEFQGALTLTNNSTSLILPGGLNITTAAGDTAIFRSEGGGNWRCISYQRAAFIPINANVSVGQVQGSALADNANAGNVGEFVSSTVLVGSAVSLTSASIQNITSISLTAGDWDVFAEIVFAPAATTTVTLLEAWTSTVSATAPTIPNGGGFVQDQGVTLTGAATIARAVGTQRLSLSATTTVYLSVATNFATSTMTAYGFIGARRRR